MAKRVLFAFLIGVPLALGIVFAIPESRYEVLAWVRDERLYEDRPVSYWLTELKDSDAAARRHAALVLGEVCEDLKDNDRYAALVLPPLLLTLGDADSFVRRCAATSFLLSPREGAVPQDDATIKCLLGALGDEQTAVRQAAVRALWQAGSVAKQADGVERLRVALRDKDDFVRSYAARALARIGPDAKAAVPSLLQRLRQDEERDVRKLSAKTLGMIGRDAVGPQLTETVELLTAALKDSYPELREYAARALGQLGATDALPALTDLTKDSNEKVRAAAVEAINRIETKK